MGPGILACCQALLATDAAEAEDNYRHSVELLCTTPITLAVARSLLVYGEWLRHRGLAAAVPTRAAVAGSLR